MTPYRHAQHRQDVDGADEATAAGAADDLVVAGVIFFLGAIVAGSGLFAEPTVTTPGVIGLMMMVFAAWSCRRASARHSPSNDVAL